MRARAPEHGCDGRGKKVTAYHEAGHAIVAALMLFTPIRHKVTIIRAEWRWA